MRSFFRSTSAFLVLFISAWALVGCGGTASPTATHPAATPTPPPSKTLYLLTASGVGAVRDDNGQVLWTSTVTNANSGSVLMTVAQGVLYIAGGSSLYALDTKTGKTLWTGTESGAEQITVQGNYVYVSYNGTIYGYHAKDGSLAWRMDIPTVNISNTSNNAVGTNVFVENNLVYGWVGDTIAALNPDNGSIVWKLTMPAQLSDYSDSAIRDVEVTPDVLVIASLSGFIEGQAYGETIGVDANKGSQLWKTTGQTLVHVVNSTVYMVGNTAEHQGQTGATLSAVKLQDGTKLWSVDDSAIDTSNPMTFSDTAFYAATGPSGGDLDVRSLQDGHVLWNSPGAGTYKSLLADGNQVFGYLDQQGVVAWDAAQQKKLWLNQNLNDDSLQMQIIDQHFYAYTGRGNPPLIVLDPTKGTTLWQTPSNNPVLAAGVIEIARA